MVLNPKILFARRNFPILTLKKTKWLPYSHFCHLTGLLHMFKGTNFEWLWCRVFHILYHQSSIQFSLSAILNFKMAAIIHRSIIACHLKHEFPQKRSHSLKEPLFTPHKHNIQRNTHTHTYSLTCIHTSNHLATHLYCLLLIHHDPN